MVGERGAAKFCEVLRNSTKLCENLGIVLSDGQIFEVVAGQHKYLPPPTRVVNPNHTSSSPHPGPRFVEGGHPPNFRAQAEGIGNKSAVTPPPGGSGGLNPDQECADWSPDGDGELTRLRIWRDCLQQGYYRKNGGWKKLWKGAHPG